MKYVIITYQIINMGGAQQYCRNKAETLKKKGYDVYIFSADKGKIYIQELKQHEYGIIHELQYPVFSFRRNRIKNVLKYMLTIIRDVDESTIIESTSIAAAQWGELIAQQTNCKHFLYNLQEMHSYSHSEINFLKFKFDRKELVGIAPQSIELMFKGFYDIQDSELYSFSASCTNVVGELDSDIADNLPAATYNIGSLGRLEKRFVYPTLCELKRFIEENQDKTFNIVLIGGSPNKRIVSRIKRVFKNVKNAKVIITGYMYPVPKKLIEKMDVFFSTAGGSRVTLHEKIPTIAMAADTGKPIGILNYTTKSTLYGESDYSFTELLQMILFENYCSNHSDFGMKKIGNSFDFSVEVDRQLYFVNQDVSRIYYNVFLLKPETTKHALYFLFGKVFGVKALELGRAILHKFKNLGKRRVDT